MIYYDERLMDLVFKYSNQVYNTQSIAENTFTSVEELYLNYYFLSTNMNGIEYCVCRSRTMWAFTRRSFYTKSSIMYTCSMHHSTNKCKQQKSFQFQ